MANDPDTSLLSGIPERVDPAQDELHAPDTKGGSITAGDVSGTAIAIGHGATVNNINIFGGYIPSSRQVDPTPDELRDYLARLQRSLIYNPLLERYGYQLDDLRLPLRARPYNLRHDRDQIRNRESLRTIDDDAEDRQIHRLYAFRGNRSDDELDLIESPQLLDELVPTSRYAVLLGDPGSGKTEWLRYHACTVATTTLCELDATATEVDRLPLPLFARLSDLAHEIARDDAELISALPVGTIAKDAARLEPHERLVSALLLNAEAVGFPREWRAWLWGRLRERTPGRIVLCLDAWDEVRVGRELLAVCLASFANVSGATIFLTSRIVGYDDGPRPLSRLSNNATPQEWQLCPFTPAETRTFVEGFFHNEREVRNKLLTELQRNPMVAGMIQNPLMATLVCIYYASEMHNRLTTLPLRRVDVYERVVTGLLGRWRREKNLPSQLHVQGDTARHLLEEIAAYFFPDEELAKDKLLELIGGYSKKHDRHVNVLTPQAILDELLASGVLIPCHRSPDGVQSYMFLHLTFQEFLTASKLARQVNDQKWDALVTVRDTRRNCQVTVRHLAERKSWSVEWQEVIVLLTGQLNDPEPLLNLLADEANDDMFRHRLALAARCLSELPPEHYLKAREKIGNAAIDVWVAHVRANTRDAIPWVERALPAVLNAGGDAATRLLATMMELLHSPDQAVQRVRGRPHDPAWAVREVAVEALFALGPAAATEFVLESLTNRISDPNEYVRRAAVKAVSNLGEAAATAPVLEALATALSDTDWDVRQAAIWALRGIGEKAATPHVLDSIIARSHILGAANYILPEENRALEGKSLRAFLQDKERENRVRRSSKEYFRDFEERSRREEIRELALTIRFLGKAAAIDEIVAILLGWLNDPSDNVRKATVEALEALAPTLVNRAVLPALVRRLADEHSEVREAAAQAVAALATPVQLKIILTALVKRLRNPDKDVHIAASRALLALGRTAVADGVLETLVELLRDQNTEVRASAWFIIGHLDLKTAPYFLIDTLTSMLREPDFEMRYWAVSTVASLGATTAHPSIFSALAELLRDSEFIGWELERAFERFDRAIVRPFVLEALSDCLSDPDIHVRARAAGIAASILGEEAATEPVLDIVTDMLAYQDDHIRLRAVEIAASVLGEKATTGPVLTILKALLLNVDYDVCLRAAAVVGLIGKSAVTEPILQALTSMLNNPEIGIRTAEATAHILGGAGLTQPIEEQLIEMLANPEPSTYFHAATIIRQFGKAAATEGILQAIMEMLRDSRKVKRAGFTFCDVFPAIQIMGAKAATEDVLNNLAEMLNDQDEHIRETAAKAVECIGKAAATPSILQALANRLCKPGGWVAARAIKALGATSSPPVVATLIAGLRHSDSDVQLAAVRVVKELDTEAVTQAVLQVLLKNLRNPDYHIRDKIEKVIKVRIPTVMIPPLLKGLAAMLHDSNRDVRATAAKALSYTSNNHRLFVRREQIWRLVGQARIMVRPLHDLTALSCASSEATNSRSG